jgi:hypothetical protein
MSWKCPSCGRQNQENYNNCACGYSGNGSVLIKQELTDYQRVSEESKQYSDIPSDCTIDQTPSLQVPPNSHDVQATESHDSPSSMPDEEVIKEIGSWLFTFSHRDCCISIGTPALQSFRLKISVGDLEDLLEFLYQKAGNEKTIRKINLSATDIIGVIDKVDRLIDEKKSKVSIKFTSEELQKITDFINLQLKV